MSGVIYKFPRSWDWVLGVYCVLAIVGMFAVGWFFPNTETAQAAESKFQSTQANLLDLARGQSGGNEAVSVRGYTKNADAATASDIWPGTTALFVAPTEARVHNIASDNALDVLAAGTFTMADAGTEDEVLVIALKTYTLRDVMSETDGFVLREAAATDTLDNIIAAINLGAGAGTKYATATTANVAPTSAVAGAGDTMTLYAETAIVTTSTVNSGWGAGNAVVGTGAQVVSVRGLVDWDTAETTTSFNMTGITDVVTGEYVWVNEIKVTQPGTGAGPNIGVITITAVTDGTVSSTIAANAGRSRNGFYAIPSIKNMYVAGFRVGLEKASGNATMADVTLLYNGDPENQLTNFNIEDGVGIGIGPELAVVPYPVWLRLDGPGIIKLQALADTNDSALSGGISIVTVPNNL